MIYWYQYRLRGFSLGCQPKGFVNQDDTYGKWGAVAYDRPLTSEEIESYELKPIEPKEKTEMELKKLINILETKHSSSKGFMGCRI